MSAKAGSGRSICRSIRLFVCISVRECSGKEDYSDVKSVAERKGKNKALSVGGRLVSVSARKRAVGMGER